MFRYLHWCPVMSWSRSRPSAWTHVWIGVHTFAEYPESCFDVAGCPMTVSRDVHTCLEICLDICWDGLVLASGLGNPEHCCQMGVKALRLTECLISRLVGLVFHAAHCHLDLSVVLSEEAWNPKHLSRLHTCQQCHHNLLPSKVGKANFRTD